MQIESKKFTPSIKTPPASVRIKAKSDPEISLFLLEIFFAASLFLSENDENHPVLFVLDDLICHYHALPCRPFVDSSPISSQPWFHSNAASFSVSKAKTRTLSQ